MALQELQGRTQFNSALRKLTDYMVALDPTSETLDLVKSQLNRVLSIDKDIVITTVGPYLIKYIKLIRSKNDKDATKFINNINTQEFGTSRQYMSNFEELKTIWPTIEQDDRKCIFDFI